MPLDTKTTGFKYIGTRPDRPDGIDKVTGKARYGADVYAPGMLHGVMVRSPHAHARIKKIDATKALALKGVKAVVTRAARLAEKGDLAADVLSAAAVVDRALFEKSSEAGMLQVIEQLEPIATAAGADRYSRLADGLIAGTEALAAFFDGEQSVMVMADDAAVRRNRLNLLSVLRNQASVLADFSRISG